MSNRQTTELPATEPAHSERDDSSGVASAIFYHPPATEPAHSERDDVRGAMVRIISASPQRSPLILSGMTLRSIGRRCLIPAAATQRAHSERDDVVPSNN